MPARRNPEWVSLSGARERLCQTFTIWFLICVDEALANAIQSGYVPLRGVPPSKILRVWIDGRLIREPSSNDIDDSCLFLKGRPRLLPDFRLVEIEWGKLVAFVRDLQPSKIIPRPSEPKVDTAFVQSVARHCEAQTRPSRSEHIAELRRELPGMTDTQYDRAKKQAIQSGILPADWSRAGRISNALKAQRN